MNFGASILIMVENEVMDEMESFVNNDQRKLVGKLGFFEKSLGIQQKDVAS
jgi:inhibitor of KinA sporulation pathway (predicted exonuclease)